MVGLYIVTQQEEEELRRWIRSFAGEAAVVVADRRRGERRRHETEHAGERRLGHDRRRASPLDDQLQALGWASAFRGESGPGA
jgi:hypothetical protein